LGDLTGVVAVVVEAVTELVVVGDITEVVALVVVDITEVLALLV
jgi:hypothetical protein